jgi:MinD-like ATPase involved in chromosome partitioning or flagellar assembly
VGGQQTGIGGQIRPELPPSSRDLSTSALLRPHKPAPSAGWRKTVYRASFGTINLGEGTKKTEENDLVAQVNQPLQGCYKIALLSLKGGVGKTTVTATLGATFASIRGDRVIAVDANPDRGTLSQKVPLETPATVRHLLRDANSIQRYSDVRSYTSQGPSRLEVLASESDPAVSEAFSAEDYARTLEILERFYSVVLTDCGTGLMHSAMSSVLEQADTLVVISSGSVDGARSASATLDWLDAHGHRELVRRSVAVINAVRPRSGKVEAVPCRAVGAVRSAPGRGCRDQPGPVAARDASFAHRAGRRRGARVHRHTAPAADVPGLVPGILRRQAARRQCPDGPSLLMRQRKSGSSSGPVTRVCGRAGTDWLIRHPA